MNYLKQKDTTMKRLAITSLTAIALLSATLYASEESTPTMPMTKKSQQSKKAKKKQSPFLIKHGLPHMTKLMKKLWDDEKLALTPEQKEKLLVIRKETMGAIKQIKPEVMQLKKEIVQAGRKGDNAAALQPKVEKLAQLEARATMVHLTCIEKTKAVLTPAQKAYLKELHKTKKAAHMKKMQEKQAQGMKCATGKCGMGK